MTFFVVIFILLFLWITSIAIVYFSLKSLFHVKSLQSESFQIVQNQISIISAARNEAEKIESLIKSLNKLDYSRDDFEVILVNDHSSDDTFETIKRSIIGIDNFKVYQNENDKSLAKKGALSFGISKAKFPFIMITDADCKPGTGWLKAFSNKFSEGFDFVFGIAPVNLNNSFINNIAAFENLKSSILTFAMANIGLSYSAAARSFGFSKESYNKIEGYKNTFETLSGDDDLLLREAVKYKMNIGMVTDKEAFVYSSPKDNFKDYLTQKARHTKTSIHYLLRQKIILGFWHLLNLIFLISPILIFINFYFIILFLIKFLSDEIITLSFQKRFGYNFNFVRIFFTQIIYESLIVINFFNALFRKDKWN